MVSKGLKGLKDFYDLVKKVIENGNDHRKIKKFLKHWNADPNIKLQTFDIPVFIDERTMFGPKSGAHSLEDIFLLSAVKNREIPFTCLIDEEKLVIKKVRKGMIGTFGDCDWEKGVLLKNTFNESGKLKLKVMLGHTHPPRYGAVCSNVYYDVHNDRFGGDYLDMSKWMKKSEIISRFHIIMSPAENQLGIFELKEEGVIVYHPWCVIIR